MTYKFLVLVAALVACDGGGGGSDDDTSTGGGNYGNGQDNGAEVPRGLDAARTWESNLSDGSEINDLNFLEDNYCVPATQLEKFRGPWVWFTYEQPQGVQLYVKATPERGVDINLLASQLPEGAGGDDQGAVVDPCETSLDYQKSNPGVSESVKLTSIDKGYHIVIGVAGPLDSTEGAFKVEIFEEE